MRRSVIAGVVFVAALASTGGAAPTQSVTLHVHRFYSAECNCFKLQFSGRVSSEAPDEYVVIMQQKCGNSFATAAGGASTVQGGSWLVEVGLPFSHASATYRARWEGHLSEPWTFRPEIPVWPLRRVGRRIQFALSAGEYPDRRMKGRIVELQRLAAGRWTRIRHARLFPSRQLSGMFTATFTVRTRGLRVRVAVPEKTAAPCYTATVTETFRT